MPNKPCKCARRLTLCIACPEVCIFLSLDIFWQPNMEINRSKPGSVPRHLAACCFQRIKLASIRIWRNEATHLGQVQPEI